MTGIMLIMVLALFSALAYWRYNSIMFMILSAISFSAGFMAPDVLSSETTTTGADIAIALGLIMYSLLCAGWAFRLMFWRSESE